MEDGIAEGGGGVCEEKIKFILEIRRVSTTQNLQSSKCWRVESGNNQNYTIHSNYFEANK